MRSPIPPITIAPIGRVRNPAPKVASVASRAVEGLPVGAQERLSVHHYRVDAEHSNSYEVWKKMGSPQKPSPEQYLQLERAGTFGTLRGMVIGSVVPSAGETSEAVADWLAGRFRGVPFPVVRSLPAGHLTRPRTLPLGVRVRLDAGAAASLTVLAPCVEAP